MDEVPMAHKTLDPNRINDQRTGLYSLTAMSRFFCCAKDLTGCQI